MKTKDKILYTALSLFARDGYEAVSVSDIAGALGLTKSALYKHYKNKRDIFDCIVAEMERFHYEAVMPCEPPEGLLDAAPEKNGMAEAGRLSMYAFAQFVFWTENEFAASFRKLLSIERFRNMEMEKMYQRFLGVGPLQYVRELIENCVGQGSAESAKLALEFYAPVAMLIDVYDATQDKRAAAEAMKRHIEAFIRELADGKDNNRY